MDGFFLIKKWRLGLFRIVSGTAFLYPPKQQLDEKTNPTHDPDRRGNALCAKNIKKMQLITSNKPE